jgi:integrase
MHGRKTRKTDAAGGREKEDSGRKHLTRLEVEKLIDAAKGGRNGTRDRCLLLLMFRHGLRGLQQKAGKRGTSQTRIEVSNGRIAPSRLVTHQ